MFKTLDGTNTPQIVKAVAGDFGELVFNKVSM